MAQCSRARAFALAALLVLLAAPAGAAADPLEDTLRSLAENMAVKPGLKDKKVGVVDFPSEQGTRFTELGAYVSQKLEVELSKLAQANGFELAERRNLDQIRQEWGLWTSDHVTPSQAQQLGSLAGLNVIILGSLNDRVDRVHLVVKAIDAATGKNLGAEDAMLPKDNVVQSLFAKTIVVRPAIAPGVPSAPPPGPVAAPPPPPDPNRLKVELWTDKPSYKLGDTIRFSFKTSKDAYVTLINVSASGAMSIIFPNQFSKGNFVKAGQIVSVPREEDGFGFILAGQPGTEIVRVVASEQPIEWTLATLPPGGEIQEITKKEVIVKANVDLAAARAKVDPAKWAESVLHVDVR